MLLAYDAMRKVSHSSVLYKSSDWHFAFTFIHRYFPFYITFKDFILTMIFSLEKVNKIHHQLLLDILFDLG